MSDGPFGFIMGEPTPEQQAQHEERLAGLRMKIEAERAAERDFFRTLSIDQLVTFNRILSLCNSTNDPSELLRWYQGRAVSVLEFVHEVCVGCGRDHTVEGLTEICEVKD